MNVLSQWLIGNQKDIGKRNMFWNMVGSGIYALASMMLGAAVTRISGADLGGYFFFAFSTFGQQMFIVSYFGIRPLHITDTNNRYSFGDYRKFRLYTSCGAILIGLFYTLLFVNPALKQWVVITMVCYKVIDGLADVYESEFQRNGKLYLTGKSNAFRTLLSVIIFLGILWITKDLGVACLAASAAQIAGFFLFDYSVLGKLEGIDLTVYVNHQQEIWKESKWLFLSAFLDLYIFSSSKYAIDAYLDPSASTYFGTIFIPTSVINLAAGFVIRPFLTVLSEKKEAGQERAFWRVVSHIAVAIGGLTIVGIVAAYRLGIPVLSLLLGAEAGQGLLPYRGALLINIAGGGFYAILNLLYYVLVMMKDQRLIFYVYGMGSLLAWSMSRFFVKRYGIMGASVSYLLLMFLLSALFATIVLFKYHKRGRISTDERSITKC